MREVKSWNAANRQLGRAIGCTGGWIAGTTMTKKVGASTCVHQPDRNVLSVVESSSCHRCIKLTEKPSSKHHLACPFRKFDPSRIRNVSQNHRIIKFDACDPALARDVRRRHIQVATQARSREPVSPSSTQHRIETHAASTAVAR
jgi:hypothetical protein